MYIYNIAKRCENCGKLLNEEEKCVNAYCFMSQPTERVIPDDTVNAGTEEGTEEGTGV